MSQKFEIGKIFRDDSGKYCVRWYGMHVGQGGSAFCEGTICGPSISDLLRLVAINIESCTETYDREIKSIRRKRK